jgi:nucleoside-diphosphate-sugar epimerase
MMNDTHEWYRGKQVLITGGLGFLGSTLAHALLPLGANVTLADPMLPLYGGNLFNIEGIWEQVEVHHSDIRDQGAMDRLVSGKDVIFHIAGQTSHVDSMIDPLLDVDINCRGNIIFLEACRKKNPEVKIVYAGTRAQYGKIEEVPVKENSRMNPTDVYGANKHVGEAYCFIYGKAFGIRVTSLRINNSYGPRHQMKHNKYGILNWFIRLAMDGETIKIFGEGNQLRDYNYLDDVIRAFLLVGADDRSVGQVYNLGSGRQIPFRELVKAVIQAADSGRYEFVPWPNDRKAIETGDFVADFSKITQEFGWMPEVELEEGLRKTVEYYRKYKEHYWTNKNSEK